MAPEPIFDPKAAGRPMRVAAFMSGSGTNIIKLLEEQDGSYEICFIFSDRQDETCRGQEIARRFGLPYFSRDIRRYHQLTGARRTVLSAEGINARQDFDGVAATLVKAFGADVIALGGYMSFLTLQRGINVHPADLSIRDENGRRRFVGDHAVHDAIAAGCTELRSSTLWIDRGVDTGPLIMVSDPVPVELPCPLKELAADPESFRRVGDEHQERLKRAGDWVVFPQSLKLIASGRLSLDESDVVWLDGTPRPQGVRPGEAGL